MIVDSYMARKTRSDIAGSVLTVQRPVAGQDLPMLRIGDGEYISTSQGTGEYAKRATRSPAFPDECPPPGGHGEKRRQKDLFKRFLLSGFVLKPLKSCRSLVQVKRKCS